MFTDNTVTPIRLEILVDLLRRRSLPRDEIYRVLQPNQSDPGSQSNQAKATVRAASELGLALESEGTLNLSSPCKREKDTKNAILEAWDEKVFGGTDVEKYFALFYSYFLCLGKEVYTRTKQSHSDWAVQFNKDVFSDEMQENPFNQTKLSGLHRWFCYVGVGWYDPAQNFQANPYERVLRTLPAIFGKNRKLSSADFMEAISKRCPELDGGTIFRQANRSWTPDDKQCSLGLGHALIELHEDGILQLDCPADCQQWSLREAEPPRDDHFRGDRFETVHWKKK